MTIRVTLERAGQEEPKVGDGRYLVRDFPEADDWVVEAGGQVTLVRKLPAMAPLGWKAQIVTFRGEDVVRVERVEDAPAPKDPREYATVSGVHAFDGVPPQE